ncbi:MAG: DUF4350 domain-containing protein, partial [Myxococcota bacterium]
MRELALVGFVCTAFGLGAYQAVGAISPFSSVNLALGAGALLLAGALALRGWGRLRRVSSRDALLEPALMLVAILWGTVLVERFAALSELRLDLTFERRYQLSSATRAALEALPFPLTVILFHDEQDPRTRRTRLLLEELARHGDVDVHTRVLGNDSELEDHFGIASSGSVVLEAGPRWERVDRPTEGALFEAISFLGIIETRVVYATAGAGEGDPESANNLGYSGLRTAFETEGYQLRRLVTAAGQGVPPDADAVLLIAPERRLPLEAVAALSRYLQSGGTLIALLEPGRESGVEALLAEFGLSSPDAVVIDPSSGSIDGAATGIDLIAFNYSEHPVTRGLNRNRRTFFRGARSFRLRKPTPEDDLRPVVFASGDSWLYHDTSVLHQNRVPDKPADAVTDYHPLVVTGRYSREGGEVRIVAFGDSDFATNQNLRALYNLDLLMNALHWSMRRESKISLRPKSSQL